MPALHQQWFDFLSHYNISANWLMNLTKANNNIQACPYEEGQAWQLRDFNVAGKYANLQQKPQLKP